MFIISDLLVTLARIVDIGLTVLYWLIIIRALISWVNPNPYNPIIQFLYKTTEPILYPIRRILPIRSVIDISPIIAFLIINILRSFLVRILLTLAATIRIRG